MRCVSFMVQGFSLIELQIALALALLSFGGIFQFHTSLLISDYKAQQYQKVNDAAGQVLTIMQRELMRAGFIQRISASDPNPFIYSGDKLFQTNTKLDCISYRYDRNKNSLLDGEFFGFRLHNNVIQSSKGNAQDCNYTLGWESIIDGESVKVTSLDFTLKSFSRDALNQTQTYIIINIDIESKLVPNLKLNFKRNVVTRVTL